jgi:hypothetical protein
LSAQQRPLGPTDPPPGLGEQLGRTKGSFQRLLQAHVGLLKAEIGDIVAQLKVMATLGGVALVLGLLIGNMLYIGGLLFLGEWLFGSIGWGLAHGVLLGVALIVALVLGILGAPMRVALLSFLIALLATIGLALLVGSRASGGSLSSGDEMVDTPALGAGVA